MNFSLPQILNVLRARYKVVLATLVAAVVVGIAAFMLLPKKYTSTSALVFDVRAQDPVSGAPIPVANNF